MNEAYTGTQAIQRAVAVLRAFGPEPQPLTPAEISQRIGLNRTTVYRLLSGLEQSGFVVADEHGRFRLGPELIVLGNLALQQIDLRGIALPELHALARLSGETVDLEILRGQDMLIIDEVTGAYMLATGGNIGRTYPAVRTSTGKALLAGWPADQLDIVLRQAMQSDQQRARFVAELVQVRTQGYATSYEELEPHLHAIGAAIYNHRGQAVAAVSISGPAARMPREREAEYAAWLRAACGRISAALGFRG